MKHPRTLESLSALLQKTKPSGIASDLEHGIIMLEEMKNRTKEEWIKIAGDMLGIIIYNHLNPSLEQSKTHGNFDDSL